MCSGNFFALDGSADAEWAKYKSGELIGTVHNISFITVSNIALAPIATYIIGPNTAEQAVNYSKVLRGGDLCENITYLGTF